MWEAAILRGGCAAAQHGSYLSHVSGCVETAYIFPGIGLGAITSRATRLRDETFIAAAEARAGMVTDGEQPPYSIYLPGV